MFSHEDRIRSVSVVGLSSESQYTEAVIAVWDAAQLPMAYRRRAVSPKAQDVR